MEHRGACGGDGVSGDGAGIMTEIPWKLLDEYRSESCMKPGVGMIFLPQSEERRNKVKQVIEDVCDANELDFLGWREVPVDPDVLGDMAREAAPSIWQFFVKAPERLSDDDEVRDGFERTLYLVRRRFEVERKKRGAYWDDEDNEVRFDHCHLGISLLMFPTNLTQILCFYGFPTHFFQQTSGLRGII